jgi:hypothetical protein
MRWAGPALLIASAVAQGETVDLSIGGTYLEFPAGGVGLFEVRSSVRGERAELSLSVPLLFREPPLSDVLPFGTLLFQEGRASEGLALAFFSCETCAHVVLPSPQLRTPIGGPTIAVHHLIELLGLPLAGAFEVTLPSSAFGGPAEGGIDLAAEVGATTGLGPSRSHVTLTALWIGAGDPGTPALQASAGGAWTLRPWLSLSASGLARWTPFAPRPLPSGFGFTVPTAVLRAHVEGRAVFRPASGIVLSTALLLGAGEAPGWGLALSLAFEK